MEENPMKAMRKALFRKCLDELIKIPPFGPVTERYTP
jgi:hypothetical protein